MVVSFPLRPLHSARQVAILSLADYFHEWRISSCFVIVLAAVLAPLLVLFALKFGLIDTLSQRLIQDPKNREITAVGSESFDRQWFADMERNPWVEFVIPRTRSIASTMKLRKRDASGRSALTTVELLPTAEGDPLLTEHSTVPGSVKEIVLSRSSADKINAALGDQVEGIVTRTVDGLRQTARVSLKVVGIVPETRFHREAAFARLDMLEATEDYRDGYGAPVLGWLGQERPVKRGSYASYRMYATSIYDVATVDRQITEMGFEVNTQAAEIETITSLDRNLSLVFWSVSLIGITGFLLALAGILWSNVERKKSDLSILRLLGIPTRSIILMPFLQAMYTSFLGNALAISVYVAIAHFINLRFAESLGEGEQICKLLPEHFAAALFLTMLASSMASIVSALRASRIEPAEGLRNT